LRPFRGLLALPLAAALCLAAALGLAPAARASTTTTLTLSASSNGVDLGFPITLTGELWYGSSEPAQGTPVTLTRTNPNGTTTSFTGVETSDGRGDFSVTDDTLSSLGTYTYTASVPATATTTSAQAQASVSVVPDPATLTLNIASPTPVGAGEQVTLTGTLSYASGAPAKGTPVTVSRDNPDGSITPITGITTSDANGDFTIADDTPHALGNYFYVASVPATATTTTAQVTAFFTVAYSGAAITLSGPASVPAGKAFSVSGKLSLAALEFSGSNVPGTPATRTPITVSRTNPNGSTTTIKGITTGANGAFTIAGNLPTPGSYAYTASVPTASGITGATSTYKLTVVKATPALTLSTGSSTVRYGSTVKVTAHLGSTHTNRTVSISASYPGSKTVKVLKTGTVNSAGNLTVSYPDATRNVVFTVKFGGDSEYAARSASARVGVDARVALSVSGWYTSTRHDGVTYRVFHHTRDLDSTITVTPNKHGECVRMDTAELVKGTWVAAMSPCFTLNSRSQKGLAGSGFADGYYRVRAVFDPSKADVTNVSSGSGWFYFEIVK